MLLHIEAGDVVLILRGPNHNLVVALELTEQQTSTIGIESVDILIEPYILARQSRCSTLLEDNLMNAVVREEVTLTLTALDCEGREVEIDNQLLQARARLEVDLQHLCLTVRVNRQVEKIALGRALREVILLIAGNSLNGATLHQDRAILAVTIEDIVNCTLVIALEYTYIIYALIEECLVANLGNNVATILQDDNHIVDIRAVADKLGILH